MTRCRRMLVLAPAALLIPCAAALAAIQGGGAANTPLLLVGLDDDTPADPLIQPPGTATNQSTRKGDTLGGGQKDDVLIGREGPDVFIAGPGDDVMVGGTEFGSNVAEFPPIDQALGGPGNDVFIWSPGDGSDAYSGGEPDAFTTEQRKVTRFVVRGGRRVRVVSTRTGTVPSKPDDDVLVLGTLGLKPGDNFQPALIPTPFGALPRANVSGVNLPATVGDSPPHPTVRGFCELVPANPASNWNFLVRFFADSGQLQATIRIRAVERVLCRTRGADTITEFALGAKGAGPPAARPGFTPPAGSRLDALVD